MVLSDELELSAHVDSSLEAPCHRTEPRVDVVHALGFLTAVGGHGEAVADSDPLDHEHLVLGLDLADRLDLEAVPLNIDLTRVQRAGKRAGQSPTGGGDHVVERGRVGGNWSGETP
jgi:hypothetical protein